MSREILFRGKTINRQVNEWVEGSLVKGNAKYDGRPVMFIYDAITEIDGRGWIGNYFGEEVDPITVTQFINAIDRNEQKIFEGDIVNVYQYKRDDEPSCVAIVLDNSTLIEDGLGRWKPQDTVRVEVIGNIFDNPELLSGGNKRWIENYWDIPEDCYSVKWAW